MPERPKNSPKTPKAANQKADGMRGAFDTIAIGRHADPFSILGVHKAGKGFIGRVFAPGADTLDAFTLGGDPIGVWFEKDEVDRPVIVEVVAGNYIL